MIRNEILALIRFPALPKFSLLFPIEVVEVLGIHADLEVDDPNPVMIRSSKLFAIGTLVETESVVTSCNLLVSVEVSEDPSVLVNRTLIVLLDLLLELSLVTRLDSMPVGYFEVIELSA